MKQLLTISVLALAASLGIRAQEVQRFEGGVFGGMTVPLENYHDYSNRVATTYGIEMRYNICNTPFDCGLRAGYNAAAHRYVPHGWNESVEFDEKKVTWSVMAVADYNLRHGAKINPYAGLGIGVGFNNSTGEVMRDAKGTSAVFMPRVGVEILHHIRIEGDFHISRKGFNTFNLTLGFSLGGRPKR